MSNLNEFIVSGRIFSTTDTNFCLQGMQGAMNQMVPPFQQGHFMGINSMQSGSAPPIGGIPSGLPNNQGPSNASGTQMYPPGGAFNRPQAGPMPPMPGLNPYQVRQYIAMCYCY